MPKDYYATLGVPRDADEKAIRTAYRRLARKYHPDVNPNDAQAEAKFKEVGEAYSVLSDPEKREKYDRFGSDWEQAGGFGGPAPTGGVDFDLGDLFGSFFGGGDAFTRTRGLPPRDVEQTVQITLEEVDKGTQRTLAYQVEDACETCGGTGQVRLQGDTLRRAACPTCRGAGVVAKPRRISVTVPPGAADGQKLRVPGGGGQGSNGRPGDLFVVVRVVAGGPFVRRGEDTEIEVSVPYTTAALGGEVRVPTPRSSGTISVPPGTQTGQAFRLKGQGLSRLGGGRGDLIARVKVTVPKSLTDAERDLLQQLARLHREDA